MINNDPIDFNHLTKAANGDEAFIREMLRLFVERTPKMIDEMMRACENKDFEKTVRLAHQLKPSVDMVGNTKTKELLMEIHSITKNQSNCEKSPGLIAEFSKQSEKVIDLINQKLKSKKLV